MMRDFQFDRSLDLLFQRLTDLNVAIDSEKPWELFKKSPIKTKEVLNGEVKRNIGLTFLRGDTIIFISPASTVATVAGKKPEKPEKSAKK